jgi:hypothetical protein
MEEPEWRARWLATPRISRVSCCRRSSGSAGTAAGFAPPTPSRRPCQRDHAYTIQLRAKPSRRIGLSGIVERLRTAEFPHIERRKAGKRRNAPVFYRIGRPGPGLDLHLPYDVAASHPLLVQRRTEATPGEPGSARRAALTERSPKSPWRRRLLLRPAAVAATIAPWPDLLRSLWTRLLGGVATITAAVTGR